MPDYKNIAELKKQIHDFKRAVNSPNGEYMTGYISALSVVEGMIASLPDVNAVPSDIPTRLIDANSLKDKWLHSDHKGMFVDFIDNAPTVPAVPFVKHESTKQNLNAAVTALASIKEIAENLEHYINNEVHPAVDYCIYSSLIDDVQRIQNLIEKSEETQ